MRAWLGGFVGLVVGAVIGWLASGSIPGAIGCGSALGAGIYGLLSSSLFGVGR